MIALINGTPSAPFPSWFALNASAASLNAYLESRERVRTSTLREDSEDEPVRDEGAQVDGASRDEVDSERVASRTVSEASLDRQLSASREIRRLRGKQGKEDTHLPRTWVMGMLTLSAPIPTCKKGGVSASAASTTRQEN